MSATFKRRAAWACVAACIVAALALALAGRLGAYGFAAVFAGASVLDVIIVGVLFWLRAHGAHEPGEDFWLPGEPCPYPACHHNQQQRGDETA